ncbi:hypothetical protein AAE478_003235 [Parahypoxylon ruwenzoriense]
MVNYSKQQGDTRHYKEAPHTKYYTPSYLIKWYDFHVIRFNLPFLWRCSVDSVLFPFFCENFSRRHLDCGVATGWFPTTALSRPFRINARHELTLLDYNEDALETAKDRVLSKTTNTTVKTVAADITAPLPKALRGAKFDSISMFNLFHCVPGGVSKLRAFGTYKHLLADGGVLVGCSVLGRKYAPNWFSRWRLSKLNGWKVFNNWEDSEEDYRQALEKEFEEVEICVIGMVLLFRASEPRLDDKDTDEE